MTEKEVRVLFYLSPFTSEESCSYIDFAQPPDEAESEETGPYPWDVKAIRLWQAYFNNRFQTYNRFVHFFAFLGGCAEFSPETRRAHAAENFQKIRPFAVVNVSEEYADIYQHAMASRGVVTFADSRRPQEFFNRFPGLVYSYLPSLEVHAELFFSYLCKKVINRSATFSANHLENGQRRRLGLLHIDDPAVPELERLGKLTKSGVENCGGAFELTRTAPLQQPPPGETATIAAENMAAFKGEGVSTIIWPGGLDLHHSHAAAALDYRPEILLLGAFANDFNSIAVGEDPGVWSQAWVITNNVRATEPRQMPCYLAAKETDPSASDEFIRTQGCGAYPSILQLFTGIQVAGPRLSARSMDQGFHAIPRLPSRDPRSPSCFYDPSDWTCVKDAMAEWWDPDATKNQEGSAVDSVPGCWRMAEGGKRYLAGGWLPGDVLDQKRPGIDLCNYI